MGYVALCKIGEEYWIAFNTQHLEAEDIDEFANFLNQDIVCWIVKNGNPGVMHAEMQLLKELLNACINPLGIECELPNHAVRCVLIN